MACYNCQRVRNRQQIKDGWRSEQRTNSKASPRFPVVPPAQLMRGPSSRPRQARQSRLRAILAIPASAHSSS
jgi:hypothetical protein